MRLLLLVLALASGMIGAAAASCDPVKHEPLPLDVAMSVRGHDERSTFAFSPDGQWIAHTVQTNDFVPAASQFFSSTGASLAEGGRTRVEAHLTDTRTGEEVALAGRSAASWAPVWSPNGRQVAFYSDQGGQTGLWLWNVATRKATRVPNVIARPFFGFEQPRWSADGKTILCKILPTGMTVAQANALIPLPKTQRIFPPHSADAPGVVVLSSASNTAAKFDVDAPSFTNRELADLALVDLQTHEVRRIVHSAKIMWYAFSPDQRWIAYTDIGRVSSDSEKMFYDIHLIDRLSGKERTLLRDADLYYGVELSWSPDSSSLAMAVADLHGVVGVTILPIDGSQKRRLSPGADAGLAQVPPRWSADGRIVYASGSHGRLWQVDVASGSGNPIGALPGWEITTLVSQADRPTAWTDQNHGSLWALAIRRSDQQWGMLRVDAATGRAEAHLLPPGDIFDFPNEDANNHTGRIGFVVKDQHHPAELWVYDTLSSQTRQVSRMNSNLDKFALGDAQVISFQGADGKNLHAALLLPPGYRHDRPLPTVVWVYGGQYGSESARTFGLWDSGPIFDMQILATRGYAILFPDTPLNPGSPTKDLLSAVLPAVDAAVVQGYSDPNRVAIMGQSFGSYCALAIISHTTRFKAAVITASSANPDLLASYLEMELDGSASRTGYFEKGQGDIGGTPWQFPRRYIENSPIYNFDKITTPVLMGQGADDGRLLGADAIFVALRRLGKSVEYRIYEGEGHVLQQDANVRDFWERRLSFLDKSLNK